MGSLDELEMSTKERLKNSLNIAIVLTSLDKLVWGFLISIKVVFSGTFQFSHICHVSAITYILRQGYFMDISLLFFYSDPFLCSFSNSPPGLFTVELLNCYSAICNDSPNVASFGFMV